MAFIRLDKLLAQSGERTRSESARLIRSGAVTLNGTPARDPAAKADGERDCVLLNGRPVTDDPFQYAVLHKPAGVLTAARDRNAPTVMALVPEALRRRDVLPVGRLDKDTTGLLLLTNDGELAHRLLSPKRHVWKEYTAVLDGPLSQADVDAFAQGMALSDFTAKPAELVIIESAPEQSRAVVRLSEGKFHQVKRMFAARGREVLRLHRQAFGPLRLDIPQGEWRTLTAGELAALRLAAYSGEPE
ncbi:MAG TPA: pseudouridine synthase [Candidatus Limiplasma sp.]|nr:pseudouridine synthase [Candidatus Limiplasma sp.]HPS80915.1 pseudouridine synthase [Candidatus Limiplasma sp.]